MICATCGATLAVTDPSPAELRVLNMVVGFHDAHGRFPTYREIRIALGYLSTQAVYTKVHALSEKGWLTLAGRSGKRAIQAARRTT